MSKRNHMRDLRRLWRRSRRRLRAANARYKRMRYPGPSMVFPDAASCNNLTRRKQLKPLFYAVQPRMEKP